MQHYTRAEWSQIAEQILGERLPGRPAQRPFAESAIQNYKVGARLQLPDGIHWHYCQCGDGGVAIPMWDRGMASLVVPQALAVVGATPAGSLTVIINDANVAHGRDYWANGKVEIWATPGDGVFQHRTIKSSTPSNGVSVTLTLYERLTNALANGDGLEICRCVYAEVDQTNAVADPTQKSIACVPLMPVTPGYWFWGQTWGPCTLAATIGTMGNLAGSRQVYFNHHDGTVLTEEEAGFVAGAQPAGYLLPDSAAGAQTIIFLQLDP
jgi:hypothetical protein